MKKILLLIFVVMLIYGCGENENFAPDKIEEINYSNLFFGSDSTFDILTWNLKEFPINDYQTTDYVAYAILYLNPDVIAFQEIQSGTYFYNLLEKLNTLDSLNTWEKKKSHSAYEDYNLAYLYNTNTIECDIDLDIYEIFNDDDEGHYWAFPRAPLIFELSWNENDIIICNNHFKALSGQENEARRKAASDSLHFYFSTNLPQHNLIMLGDLNDDLTEPLDDNVFESFLADTLNYQFVDMEIALSDTADWSYPSWPSHLDHILISNELFDEMENNASKVKTISIDEYLQNGWTEYENNISDHRPVGLKLEF